MEVPVRIMEVPVKSRVSGTSPTLMIDVEVQHQIELRKSIR
jgi:hypothetical protein